MGPCDRPGGQAVFMAEPLPMRPDPDAFLAALRPHYDDALRTCRGLCAGWRPDEAEDVFQSALLTALERFGQLDDPAAFRPWFFRVLTRTFYSAVRWRRVRRVLPLPTEAQAADLGLYADEPEAGDRVDLMAALARLGPKERAALLLYEVAGLSLAEIAGVQGDRTRSAVKSRLARARRRAAALDPALPALA